MSDSKKSQTNKENINYGYDSEFPTILRKLLEKTTQGELAKVCNVSRQSVAQWKNGKTKPDIYYLGKIADFFNVSTDYLLGRSSVQSTDTDVKMICEYTGLSEYSVDVLHFFREYHEINTTINLILESEMSSCYDEIAYWFMGESDDSIDEMCQGREWDADKIKKHIMKLKHTNQLQIVTNIAKYLNIDFTIKDKILSITESGNMISLSETNADYAKNINLDDLFSIQTIKQSEIVERVLMDNIVDKLKKAKKMLKEQKAGEINGDGN